MQRAYCRVPGSHLPLVFRLGAVLGIMALLVAVIARDFGSIPSAGTVPTSPLWDFLLGFLLGFFLGFSGLASVSLGGVGLGGILLTLGGASLSVPSLFSTRLFPFSPSSPGGFWLAGRRGVGPGLRSCGLIVSNIEAHLQRSFSLGTSLI